MRHKYCNTRFGGMRHNFVENVCRVLFRFQSGRFGVGTFLQNFRQFFGPMNFDFRRCQLTQFEFFPGRFVIGAFIKLHFISCELNHSRNIASKKWVHNFAILKWENQQINWGCFVSLNYCMNSQKRRENTVYSDFWISSAHLCCRNSPEIP